MRITNMMLGQNLLRNLETAQSKMDDYQNELSSGHRIFKPSDDPVGIEIAMRLKSNLGAVKQWSSNASQGTSFLQTTDSALGDIMEMLQRARELAVQGNNGTTGVSGRQNIAYEITQINEQVGVVAKTKVAGKYLFGGTNTNPPWDGTTWTGNAQQINVEVGSQATIPINVDATSLFNGGVFQTLQDLQTHLNDPSQPALDNDIAALDAQMSQVMAKRAEVGARANRLETIQGQLDSTVTNLTKTLSDVQDVDVAKVVVDLNSQENVYRAALSVGARIIQPSLVDFLK